jgi:hypothetical protein
MMFMRAHVLPLHGEKSAWSVNRVTGESLEHHWNLSGHEGCSPEEPSSVGLVAERML